MIFIDSQSIGTQDQGLCREVIQHVLQEIFEICFATMEGNLHDVPYNFQEKTHQVCWKQIEVKTSVISITSIVSKFVEML